MLLLLGLFEVEAEVEGEGEDDGCAVDAWGTVRPGCKGGGGEVTTPLLLPDEKCSKRPNPGCSCS